MLAGQLSIGTWAIPLAARGVSPWLMQIAFFASMVVEALIIAQVGPTLAPGCPAWCRPPARRCTACWRGYFSAALAGRVTTCINLVAFGVAGGSWVGWWMACAAGMSAATALVVAFVPLLAAQALSFIPPFAGWRLQPVA